MVRTLNKYQMPVYLYPAQHKELKELKKTIKLEYGLSIPMTEMLRDSIKLFLKDHENEEALREYLQLKGLL